MFFIKNKILIILLFAVAALCAAFFISEDITAHREMAEYMKLESAYTKMYTPIHEQSATGTPNETAYLPYLEVDFGSLLETNPETVGWLAIPGTVISYPVLQADDNIKYLNTSFYGERSGTGAIFMDSGNAVNPLDQNTIIYGHHIAGREDMFGTLLYYSDQSYYSVALTTNYYPYAKNYLKGLTVTVYSDRLNTGTGLLQ